MKTSIHSAFLREVTTLMIEEKKISRGGKQILGGKKDQMEPQEKNSFFGEKMVRRNHATRQKKRCEGGRGVFKDAAAIFAI